MVHNKISFEIAALFHCPWRQVKKRGKFKANLSFDQMESFLYCLSSSFKIASSNESDVPRRKMTIISKLFFFDVKKKNLRRKICFQFDFTSKWCYFEKWIFYTVQDTHGPEKPTFSHFSTWFSGNFPNFHFISLSSKVHFKNRQVSLVSHTIMWLFSGYSLSFIFELDFWIFSQSLTNWTKNLSKNSISL